VRLALREGARLAAGGSRPADRPEGSYLAATVLADVTPEMQIFTEPVCGPLVRVARFEGDEEAVALTNAVTNPAATYIWAGDLERARRLAPAIESASVWINSQNPNDEAGSPGIDFFTRSQTVFIADERNPR
jgi:5-carboxymethyl-2-hydroxymuconic-semialdehyde dehydrogenase